MQVTQAPMPNFNEKVYSNKFSLELILILTFMYIFHLMHKIFKFFSK